jgi:hypothetical protein
MMGDCHCAWNAAKRSGSAESMGAFYLFGVVVFVFVESFLI